MEYCSICELYYKKSFKSDHVKSVKHLEKLNQYYCKKCNLYMPLSDKQSHLESNDHKINFKKIWCDVCNKEVVDITRHLRSEIHIQRSQNNISSNHSVINPSVTSGLVVNSKTYIKYKIFEDFERKVNDILSQRLFPKFKLE